MKTFNNYICEAADDSPDALANKIGVQLARAFDVDRRFPKMPYWYGIGDHHASEYSASMVTGFIKTAMQKAGCPAKNISVIDKATKNYNETGFDAHFVFRCEYEGGEMFITVGAQSINDESSVTPTIVHFVVGADD